MAEFTYARVFRSGKTVRIERGDDTEKHDESFVSALDRLGSEGWRVVGYAMTAPAEESAILEKQE